MCGPGRSSALPPRAAGPVLPRPGTRRAGLSQQQACGAVSGAPTHAVSAASSAWGGGRLGLAPLPGPPESGLTCGVPSEATWTESRTEVGGFPLDPHWPGWWALCLCNRPWARSLFLPWEAPAQGCAHPPRPRAEPFPLHPASFPWLPTASCCLPRPLYPGAGEPWGLLPSRLPARGSPALN